jgi:2-methylcitrate dehydratase PrpD
MVVVRVTADEAAIVSNREIPDICLQHPIAVMLMDRTITFQSAHARERMQDPAVLRQRAKVELVPDEALERLMPAPSAGVVQGSLHVKLAASSILPEPLYFATCG